MKRTYLILPLLLLLAAPGVLAQSAFEGTQGSVNRSALPIYGGGVEDLEVASNGNIYAGLGSPNGIFCSSDGGDSWDGPPEGSDFGSVSAVEVGSSPNTVFVIAGIDLYRSTDGCESWSQLSGAGGENDFGQSMAFDGSTLVAAFRDGTVHVSGDDGESFTSRTIDGSVTEVKAVAAAETEGIFYALVGTDSGNKVFRSGDSGESWSDTGGALTGGSPSKIGVHPDFDSIVVVSGNDSVEISTDSGGSFADVTPGGLAGSSISYAVVSSTTRLFVGSSFSDDNGASWNELNDSATTDSALRGPFRNDPDDAAALYAASNRGVAKSTDSTASWSDTVEGMLGVQIAGIAQDEDDKNILYLAALGGIARTRNYLDSEGPDWTYPIDVVGDGTSPTAIILPDATDSDTVLVAAFGEVHRSTDGGDSWSGINTGVLENREEIGTFAGDGAGTVYGGFRHSDDDSGGVAVSTDGGLTWSDTNVPNDPPVNALLLVDGVLFAGVGSEGTTANDQRGIYKREDGSWSQLSGEIDGKKINALAYNESYIFAAAGDVSDGAVFRSDDMGASWEDLSGEFDEVRCMQSLAVNPGSLTNIYVAFGCPAGTAVIYSSDDGGETWSTYYTGLKDEVPSVMLFDDLIVGLNTGAYEFGGDGSGLSEIQFRLKRTRKTNRRGKRKYRLIATAVDGDGEKLSNQQLGLQYKRRKKQSWRFRGRAKTTNAGGKVRWIQTRNGFYRVQAEGSSSVTSRKRKIRGK